MPPCRILTDADAALRLVAPLARERREVMAIAFLDPEWRLLGLRHVVGEKGRLHPSLRTLIRDALAFDASAAICAHNHPSGDPTPSAEDIAFTRDLAAALHAVEVRLADHLIVATDGHASFRALGLL